MTEPGLSAARNATPVGATCAGPAGGAAAAGDRQRLGGHEPGPRLPSSPAHRRRRRPLLRGRSIGVVGAGAPSSARRGVRYHAGGVAGLHDRRELGRPQQLSEAEQAALAA